MSTLLREIRQAPSARKTVSTTGNSSGSVAMAIAMPASKPCFQTSAPPPRVNAEGHHHERAGHEPHDGEGADQAPGLFCRRVGSGSTCSSALPILPSSERRPVATISAMPCPAVTRVPEKTEGRSSPPGVSSARASTRRHLPDRNGLSGQQRLIRRKVDASAQETVRRDAVALGKDDEVAPHHFAPCDAPMHAITDDEGPGARQISQRLQGSFRAPLLDDGDGHDHEHEAEQHQGIGRLAHEEVQASRGDEHEEHGLTSNLEADGQQAPLLLRGKLVDALPFKPRAGLLLAQTRKATKVNARRGAAAGQRFLRFRCHRRLIHAISKVWFRAEAVCSCVPFVNVEKTRGPEGITPRGLALR